jgi:polyisoprenyl-teichoic acid--peptidoglycan teichoic acid transferase
VQNVDEREPRWVRWLLAAVWTFIALATVVLVLLWQARSVVDEFSAGLKAKVVQAAAGELGEEPARPSVRPGRAKVILAVGSDRRFGESGKGRSDTMLLVRVDREHGTVSMLSLPRDLRVTIPGHGTDKLNAAYARGGMKLLIRTVREALGVRIDHFVQVDFGGFREIVSAVGGVYLPVDGRYFNRNVGTAATNYANIDLRPGYQRLSAQRALEFVRFRHVDSDFLRAARQQLFLREVGRQVQAGLSDVGTVRGLVNAIAEATTSDLASVPETLRLGYALRSTPPDRVNRVVLDGDPVMLGGVWYVAASRAQRRAAVRRWARPGRRITAQRRKVRKVRRARRAASVPLVSDGGAGRRLAAGLGGVRACAPRGLPAGYRWGPQQPARTYELAGRRAAAMWATSGSGRSLLFMFTRWQRPPVLARPSTRIRLAGRGAELFYESGRLRMVAWRDGGTRAWVTNTLRNEVPDRTLVALARSCMGRMR